MNAQEIGKLIYTLRREHGMTRKELAKTLQVGAKTVSKWERGNGCPDVSLLEGLALTLNVTVEQLLSGKLPDKKKDSGNVARMQFYLCPHCGNIVMGTGVCEPVCCGHKLPPAVAQQPDEQHSLHWQRVEDDYYVTYTHPQNKDHYLQFAALVNAAEMEFVRLYPEQDGAFRLNGRKKGMLYYGCSKHGVFKVKIQ